MPYISAWIVRSRGSPFSCHCQLVLGDGIQTSCTAVTVTAEELPELAGGVPALMPGPRVFGWGCPHPNKNTVASAKNVNLGRVGMA